MFRRLAICFALSIAAGCSVPDGDTSTPTGAHYQWLAVRGAGDAAGMWEMLDPAARAEFERWSLVEKLMLNEIRTAYPSDDVEAALKAIGGSARGELANGKALFAMYITGEAPGELGALGSAGARARDEVIDEGGRSATVKTWGGDEVKLVADEAGRWFMQLPGEEMERLRNSRARAEQNLERVRNNLKKLGRQGN